MKNTVVVFARAPVLGTVKSRLARALGHETALKLYRAMAERTVDALSENDVPWRLCVACTPDDRVAEVQEWFGSVDKVFAQGEGDLGERMKRAVKWALREPDAKVLLVGTDCPALDAERVHNALRALERYDAVLGPARDGGYWLIGMKRLLEVFDGVDWGSSRVTEQTRTALRRAGATWKELGEERDIDTVDDLEAVAKERGWEKTVCLALRSRGR